jgi:hypothetical protein
MFGPPNLFKRSSIRYSHFFKFILALVAGSQAGLSLSCRMNDTVPTGADRGGSYKYTPTLSFMPLITFTRTATSVPSASPTRTFTPTPSVTNTPSVTLTLTDTPPDKATDTETPTDTDTPSVTASSTQTNIVCPGNGAIGTFYSTGSPSTFNSINLRVQQVVLTNDVILDGIVVYGQDLANPYCVIEGGVYADKAGSPGALVASGAPVSAVSSSCAARTITVTS